MSILRISSVLILLVTASTLAQPFNQEVNASSENPMLLGKINKEGLSGNSYASWYTKNFEDYKPDSQMIATLKQLLPEYTITAFMGTWCGDSKMEIPRFYKVIEAAEFPIERLTLVAVDRAREAYKQSPGGEEEGLNIHRVPTFIFYKDGKEVNRIVEHPVSTFEDDMLQLLTSDYTPNYHAVTIVNDALQSMGLKKFKKKSKKLLPKIKPLAKNMYELNTYSSVLFFSGKRDEGIAVARLNTLLFPEEADAYSRLANKLFQINKKTEAKENYEKALVLDPENKQAKNGMTTLAEEIK
jgi:thiol-disulfide isomerase/thioredoxin